METVRVKAASSRTRRERNCKCILITRLIFRVVGYLIENFLSTVCFANIYMESQSSRLTPGISGMLSQRRAKQLRLGAVLARLLVCPELLHALSLQAAL